MENNQILIIGAINIDIVNYVEEFPSPGETIASSSSELSIGGKATNVAIQTALLFPKKNRNQISLIAMMGQDQFGMNLKDILLQIGLNFDGIIETEKSTTGIASINVRKDGENTIVLSAGANFHLSKEVFEVPKIYRLVEEANFICLQNEISLDLNLWILNTLKKFNRKCTVIYNPSPAKFSSYKIFPFCDFIILSLSEAVYFKDQPFPDIYEDQKLYVIQLHEKLYNKNLPQNKYETKINKCIILTNGPSDIHYIYEDQHGIKHQGSVAVEKLESSKIISTVGAGDSFTGAFIFFLSCSYDLEKAIFCASTVAGNSIQHKGASSSYLSRSMLPDYLFMQ